MTYYSSDDDDDYEYYLPSPTPVPMTIDETYYPDFYVAMSNVPNLLDPYLVGYH